MKLSSVDPLPLDIWMSFFYQSCLVHLSVLVSAPLHHLSSLLPPSTFLSSALVVSFFHLSHLLFLPLSSCFLPFSSSSPPALPHAHPTFFLHPLPSLHPPYSVRDKFVEVDLKPVCKHCYERLPDDMRRRLAKRERESKEKKKKPLIPMCLWSSLSICSLPLLSLWSVFISFTSCLFCSCHFNPSKDVRPNTR